MWRLKQLTLKTRDLLHSIRIRIRRKIIRNQWKKLIKRHPTRSHEKILLHIGCGDIDAPGFINIDARKKSHVHIVTANLFELDNIPDNVAHMIYMSHVLEHVSHRELITTLREMHRILTTSGILRVSVPDFDKIINIYQSTENNIAAIEQPLMGGQDYSFNYHYSVFNGARLHQAMTQAGFKETRAWDPNNCEHHDFDDWASKNISYRGKEFPISLNIEGIK